MRRAFQGDRDAGERLANNVTTESFARGLVEGNGLAELLGQGRSTDKKITGRILLGLSMSNAMDVSSKFIQQISTDLAKSISVFLECGADGVEALVNVLVKKWNNSGQRQKAAQLSVAKFGDQLRNTKEEAIQTSILNALIRLATSDLQFSNIGISLPHDVLFSILSSVQPQSVRSRAIVLLSTIVSKERENSTLLSTIGSRLSDFISARFSGATSEEYITAFSVLTSVFTIRPDMGAQIFLQDGFLEEAMEGALNLEDEAVLKSLLELLSAAAIDKKCRAKISSLANGLLQECAKSDDVANRALSGSILAKLSSMSTENPKAELDLLEIFKDALASENESALLSAVEGLAFASRDAKTKEQLINDSNFVSSLLVILKSPGKQHPLVYGCLNILVNLTAYKPLLTEEETRINEIRHIAKEVNAQKPDEADDNIRVTARCKAILKAGLLPTLNVVATHSSPACITAIAHVLQSVSTTPAHRGQLVHHGAVKLILALLGRPVDQGTQITLAHALAKILISVNPSLVFSSRTPITAAISPLTTLLTTESLPNELPRFEALLALTNLASAPDDAARNAIVDKGWTVTEALLLNENSLIQRAAVELVCNLTVCQKGADKFLPSKTSSAPSRLHLLLALADVEDVKTRRAAAGTLAMLADFEEICDSIGEVERGVERACGIVGDDDDDVAFRGVILLLSLLKRGNETIMLRVRRVETANDVQKLRMRTGIERIKNACGDLLETLSTNG